jgi:hypothetical protein
MKELAGPSITLQLFPSIVSLSSEKYQHSSCKKTGERIGWPFHHIATLSKHCEPQFREISAFQLQINI